MEKKDRLNWIDFAKGITMLLVIIGHTVSDNLIRGLIFSFHMPLFFILSCLTYRFSISKQELKNKIEKSFRHLIIPAIIVFGIGFVYKAITEFMRTGTINFLGQFLKEEMLTLIYCSGSRRVPQAFPFQIPALGIPWFLVVLFLGRNLFDGLHFYLKRKSLLIVSGIASVCGVELGQYMWLPFSFDIALAILPFLCVALYLKKYNTSKINLKKLGVSFGVWIMAFFLILFAEDNYLQLAPRQYPMFPVCYISAVAGTIAFEELSKLLCDMKILRPILYLGRYSMYMLIIHSLDSILFPELWKVSVNEYINCIMRIFIDSSIFIMVTKGRNLLNRKEK